MEKYATAAVDFVPLIALSLIPLARRGFHAGTSAIHSALTVLTAPSRTNNSHGWFVGLSSAISTSSRVSVHTSSIVLRVSTDRQRPAKSAGRVTDWCTLSAIAPEAMRVRAIAMHA